MTDPKRTFGHASETYGSMNPPESIKAEVDRDKAEAEPKAEEPEAPQAEPQAEQPQPPEEGQTD